MRPDDTHERETATGLPDTRPSLLLSLIQQEIAALDAERLAMQAETNALATYLTLLREERE